MGVRGVGGGLAYLVRAMVGCGLHLIGDVGGIGHVGRSGTIGVGDVGGGDGGDERLLGGFLGQQRCGGDVVVAGSGGIGERGGVCGDHGVGHDEVEREEEDGSEEDKLLLRDDRLSPLAACPRRGSGLREDEGEGRGVDAGAGGGAGRRQCAPFMAVTVVQGVRLSARRARRRRVHDAPTRAGAAAERAPRPNSKNGHAAGVAARAGQSARVASAACKRALRTLPETRDARNAPSACFVIAAPRRAQCFQPSCASLQKRPQQAASAAHRNAQVPRPASALTAS
ncbi:hypothetical protein FGB62_25g153 [Gracilaria domingensis]|nr:hypothetical protein FGB62_25g153 [Gracilaria domingensis]